VDTDVRIDELFAAPLEEFTARRNDLAKTLVAEGDKESAARVRALQKPNGTARALNQLASSEPEGIDELLGIAERVRAVQRGEDGDLRALHGQLRDQVAKLLMSAVSEIEANGKQATQTLKNQITQSLMAASAEEQLGIQLRAGRLSRELQPGGFDSSGDVLLSPRSDARTSQQHQEAEERAARLLEEAEVAQKEALELAQEADRAERSAQRARTRAQEAAAAAEALQARAEAVRNRLHSEAD
jgi:hypothetical protein